MAQEKITNPARESDDSWFPQPLEFPDEAGSALYYFDQKITGLLDDPPLLGEEEMRLSCETKSDEVFQAVEAGQKSIENGAISAARAILEPVAVNHIHACALTGLCCFALGRYQRAISYFEALDHMIPYNAKPNFYQSVVNAGRWLKNSDHLLNLEGDAMSLLCGGVGIDIGYTGEKICPDAIGIDDTPGGEKGARGSQKSVTSKADITARGDYLPMFETGQFDYAISRHNLEHYQDHIKALLEWTRTLKPGGLLGIVTPDHEWVDTILLDPTHYHVFTRSSLQRLISLLPDIKLIHTGVASPLWSVMAIAQKTPCKEPFNYLKTHYQRENARCLARKKRYLDDGHPHYAGECETEAGLLKNLSLKLTEDGLTKSLSLK